jgi:hypothetical protein
MEMWGRYEFPVFSVNANLWTAAFICSPSRFATSRLVNQRVLVSSPISVDRASSCAQWYEVVVTQLLFEKLTVAQPLNTLPAFYGSRRMIML